MSERLPGYKTYQEEGRYPGVRDRVIVVWLGEDIYLVAPEHNAVRKIGVTGTAWGFIPQSGGEQFWVQHDESDEVGAYRLSEIAQISREVGPTNPDPAES